MQKIIISIIYFPLFFVHVLSFSMPQLPEEYKSNLSAQPLQTFKKLKKRKLCQTHPDMPAIRSSKPFRAMAFEALRNCGHPHPEVVMLINDDKEHVACAGKFYTQKYIGINFNEVTQGKFSYGNHRTTLHHEAAHIVRQEYATDKTQPLWHLESQNFERSADYMSIVNVGCIRCAREFAQEFIDYHNNTDHTHPLLKAHQHITLADSDQMSACAKKKLLVKTYNISKKLVAEHPINLERCLRLHQISLAHGDTLCAKHQMLSNQANNK